MCIYVLKQLLHDKITDSFGDQQLQGLKLQDHNITLKTISVSLQ